MSLRDGVFTCGSHRFPRVSGDEPAGEGDAHLSDQFSPRERG